MNNLQNLSKIKQINNIELLRNEINKFRPLSREQEDRIMQKFRLDWNYHSNVIEGNSLNFGETIAFLRHGLTAKGKPLKDHLDIRGHNNAINVLMDLIKGKRTLTENDIRELHEIILVEPYEIDARTSDGKKTRKIIKLGQYKTQPNHVKTQTGEIHYYATPEVTPAKMKDLMEWFAKTSKDKTIHPLVLAAIFHHRFVAIHPFDDGNGRMARILMNYVLIKNNYPPIVIKQENRNEYYAALSQADAGDYDAKNYDEFVILLAENLIHSLEIYFKGAKGESIEEPDDLDKELDLFKTQFKGNVDKIELKRTVEVQSQLFEQSLKPFMFSIIDKFDKFKDLFVDINQAIIFQKDEQFFYNKKDNLQDILFNKIEFERIIVVVRFEDFKSEKNPFSIELKILIDFEKYRYKLAYYFSEIDELKDRLVDEYFIVHYHKFANNLYHQNLEINEIENISTKFGKELLGLIKKIDKNPDYNFEKKEIKSIHNFNNNHFKTNDIDYLYASGFKNEKYCIGLYFNFIQMPNQKIYFNFNLYIDSLKKELKINRNFGCFSYKVLDPDVYSIGGYSMRKDEKIKPVYKYKSPKLLSF